VVSGSMSAWWRMPFAACWAFDSRVWFVIIASLCGLTAVLGLLVPLRVVCRCVEHSPDNVVRLRDGVGDQMDPECVP